MKSSSNSPRFEPLLALAASALLGCAALAWFLSRGYLLYYGDAQAHLNIARRLVDNRTPNYFQIGTSWLPLPHWIMAPFAARDSWWRSGLAGGIPGVVAFAIAGAFLFASARRLFDSAAAGWAALAVFGLNPNVLYLASIPMTEAYFFASLFGTLYFLLVAKDTRSQAAALAAGFTACAGTLVRYDGWILLPFFALYLLIATRSLRLVVWFTAVASIGPLYWLAHNAYFYSDPLEFYRGEWSAKAIYLRQLAEGVPRHPGDHDWGKSWLYFRSAAQLAVGGPLLWIGLPGLIRRPLLLIVLLPAPLFYIYSMYSGVTPINVPFWPNSYYNTRYSLSVLPLLALGIAALAAYFPRKIAIPAAATVALVPWLLHPTIEYVVCWKESQVNSVARRAWTAQAADFLRNQYHGGGIAASFSDLTGIFPLAGIPLRETLHQGNEPAWEGPVARPDLMLHEEWVVTLGGDELDKAFRRTPEVPYERVKIISVSGAKPVTIYRHRPHVSHDDPVPQSSR